MREILFRGRRADNGEWVYGYLVRRPSAIQMPGYAGPWYIDVPPKDPDDSGGRYNVMPETVGQYTGITDVNDKKIFEGDIVSLHYFFTNYDAGTLGAFEDEKVITARISINEYGVVFDGEGEHGFLCNYVEEPEEELEIIGNIYDGLERKK